MKAASELPPLPADPDDMNEQRSDWAAAALDAFCSATRCEKSEAMGDLLCNLMHLADRTGQSFSAALQQATAHYLAETGREDLPGDSELSNFVVLHRNESLKPADPPLGFQCDATDAEHAEEQCENAYPGCVVVWVWQGPRGVGVEPALQDYWNSALNENQPSSEPSP